MIIKRSYNDSESMNKGNSKTVISRLYILLFSSGECSRTLYKIVTLLVVN